MDRVFQDLMKKFRMMDDESQQNVIRRVSQRDKEAGEILKKVYRMQKRGEEISNIADRTIDQLKS